MSGTISFPYTLVVFLKFINQISSLHHFQQWGLEVEEASKNSNKVRMSCYSSHASYIKKKSSTVIDNVHLNQVIVHAKLIHYKSLYITDAILKIETI